MKMKTAATAALSAMARATATATKADAAAADAVAGVVDGAAAIAVKIANAMRPSSATTRPSPKTAGRKRTRAAQISLDSAISRRSMDQTVRSKKQLMARMIGRTSADGVDGAADVGAVSVDVTTPKHHRRTPPLPTSSSPSSTMMSRKTDPNNPRQRAKLNRIEQPIRNSPPRKPARPRRRQPDGNAVSGMFRLRQTAQTTRQARSNRLELTPQQRCQPSKNRPHLLLRFAVVTKLDRANRVSNASLSVPTSKSQKRTHHLQRRNEKAGGSENSAANNYLRT